MKFGIGGRKLNLSFLDSPMSQLYIIPLIIFVSAFILRVVWIGTYAGQDEVYYVGYASDILHGKSFANVFPPLFEMILVPILWATHENLMVIHIFMAFLGALSVLFVYLIGRKFVNKWVGIVGALLLMFNTTHWFFSAFGMLDVPATLFATSAVYFLWSGYTEKSQKQLLIGALLNVAAVFVRYTIFPSAALFLYWLFFDRQALKNKKLLAAILLPFIVWGIWMVYFITQVGWLWSWWLQYVTGQLSINIPWYFYFQAVHFEYLGQPLAFLSIFTSLFLIFNDIVLPKYKKGLNFIFLLLFIGAAYFLNNYYFSPTTEAAIGFAALALPMLYFFQISDFDSIMSNPSKIPGLKRFAAILFILTILVFLALFYMPQLVGSVSFLSSIANASTTVAQLVSTMSKYSLLLAAAFFVLIFYLKVFNKPLQKHDFNKFLILLIMTVFLFYSPLGVKFPRYVMSSLPAIYLLVGELFFSIRKYRIYLAVALVVLALFIVSNSFDTINKLVVDKTINVVKFESQKYVNDNSPDCAPVYSRTWYGFYYLRDRVTDLPSDASSLDGIIKSRCSCPPQYFIVEGAFDPQFSNVTTHDRSFHQDSFNYQLGWKGITTSVAPIAPVDVYKISSDLIKSDCPSQ